MDLRKCILTKNECYQVGKEMTPKGIVWHSTGANNTSIGRYVPNYDGMLKPNKYDNHWDQFRPSGRQACVHAFIGKDKDDNICTYQTLPFDMAGWHVGGSGNNDYIGFEICEDKLTDKVYFDKVYKEAVEFTAHLCELFKLNPYGENVIICHQDAFKLGIGSNHSDIYPWFNKHGKTMDDVRNDVYALLNTVEDYSGYVKVIYDGLAIHNKPSWDNSTVSGTVKKNEVFTIVGRIKVEGVYMYKLKSGAYITSATKYVEYLKELPTKKTIEVGSKVKIKSNAKYGGLSSTRGRAVPLWVRIKTHKVILIQTNKGVKEGLLEGINSWVALDYLTLA